MDIKLVGMKSEGGPRMGTNNKPNEATENLRLQTEIDRIKRMLTFFVDQQPQNAKILKARFDSLIFEGLLCPLHELNLMRVYQYT